MYLTPGLLLKIPLLILGGWWCKEIIGRFRADLTKLREGPDNVQRLVVVVIWLITLAIVYAMGSFIWGLIAPLARCW